MTTSVPYRLGLVRRPRGVGVAGSVTSKAQATYRVLAAVTARESGTLYQGQVPPVLSGGGRLGRETGAPVTSSYLNCARIDAPILGEEPLYLLPVDTDATFSDPNRRQLTPLNQVVHAASGNGKVRCGVRDTHPDSWLCFHTHHLLRSPWVCFHVVDYHSALISVGHPKLRIWRRFWVT